MQPIPARNDAKLKMYIIKIIAHGGQCYSSSFEAADLKCNW